MYSPRLYKYRDSYVLYIPTVHAFGSVFLTHTLLVQTHTWRFCPWYFHVGKLKCLLGISDLKRQITLFVNWFFSLIRSWALTLFVWIYVRKSPEKSFWEKNLKIKTLVKKYQFSEVLDKMLLKIKSRVLGSWDFFS